MIGQPTTPGITRHTPAAPVRKALIMALILVGSGAVETTTGFARTSSQPQPTPQTNQSVLPSQRVMREMRDVIIALYGPRPPASTPAEPQCSPPAHRSRPGASRP
jgi:hypothetical protein